jgi:hypothetical protein
VLHWNRLQHASANPLGQAARGGDGQDAEEGAARGNPGQGALEHADREAAIEQVAGDDRGERAIGREVGAQEHGGGLDASPIEGGLQQRRGQVKDRDGIANQRQRRAHAVEALVVAGHRQVTGLPP